MATSRKYLVDVDVFCSFTQRNMEFLIEDIEDDDTEDDILELLQNYVDVAVENQLDSILENHMSFYDIDEINISDIRKQ